MKIEHVKQLGGTPYLGFAVHAHNELLAENRADEHVQMVAWDNKAVVAMTNEGTPFGIITYSHSVWSNTFGIFLGFVMRGRRGEGAYRAMWNALVEKAREDGVYQITGVTHIDNGPMRAVAKKLGRAEESVNLRFYVPK